MRFNHGLLGSQQSVARTPIADEQLSIDRVVATHVVALKSLSSSAAHWAEESWLPVGLVPPVLRYVHHPNVALVLRPREIELMGVSGKHVAMSTSTPLELG